jgi:FMN phosphatase YigB (HAD superfamily)
MAKPTPAIFVDVDDTLVRTIGTRRIPVPATVAIVKALKDRGAELFLWSRGGAGYARQVARELEIEGCFDAFLPKPQLLLDDAEVGRWSAVELHPAQLSSMTVDEVLARLET